MSKFLNKLAFGGLTTFNEDSINIRKQQIQDGYRLHSCFYYGSSLDVIREASNQVGIIPKITTKVYYNLRMKSYRDASGLMVFQGIHNTIYNQLELIVGRLGFIPKSWHIQLCAITKLSVFTTLEFLEFKKKVESNFGKTSFFIENSIAFEKNIKNILINKYVDGVTFRDSAFESQSSLEMRDYLTKNGINFSTYASLSGGSEDYAERYLKNGSGAQILTTLLNDTKTKAPLDLNLSFLRSQMELSFFKYGVINVSSLKHYRDLVARLNNIDVLHQEQIERVEKLKQESYSRLAWFDDYGGAKRPTLSVTYLKHRIKKMTNRIKDVFNGKGWV